MPTDPSTIDFLRDQLGDIPDIVIKPMFGEYGLWIDGKMVALVCDDTFFLKPSPAIRSLTTGFEEAPPYPGATPIIIIPADLWENKIWFSKLLLLAAEGLPSPKPKKTKH